MSGSPTPLLLRIVPKIPAPVVIARSGCPDANSTLPASEDDSTMNDLVRGLKCRLCGKTYPRRPINCCDDDYGPLEVDYDYDAIREVISRDKIELRPFNMWRYREL